MRDFHEGKTIVVTNSILKTVVETVKTIRFFKLEVKECLEFLEI